MTEYSRTDAPGMAMSHEASRGLEGGALTLPKLMFMVLAFLAPLLSMLATVPTALAFGNGIGAPGVYLVLGVIVLLFAVGYTTLSRHVFRTGALYFYITRGLGRVVGVGAAFLTLLTYFTLQASVYGLFGLFATGIFQRQLGIDLPWQVYAFAAVAVVAILGYREIGLSARLLSFLVILEVVLLIVFAVAVVVQGGDGGLSAAPFAPHNVFGGAFGISALFILGAYVGFEEAPNFAEETKEPKRTVPLATYLVVIATAILYVFVSWAAVLAFGTDNAVATAQKGPSAYFFDAMTRYVSSSVSTVMQFLILSSLVAVLLGLHNSINRYIFALGRERLLPRAVARTHPRFASPYVAGFVQTTAAIVIVLPFAVADADPFNQLFAWIGAVGTLGLVLLLALCSVAVIGYFARTRAETGLWNTLVAPGLAAASLTAGIYLVLKNFDKLVGTSGPSWLGTCLAILPFAATAVGIGLGLWIRDRRPDRYALIGTRGEPDVTENEAGVLSGSDATARQLA